MYKDQPEILGELRRCADEQISIFREMKYDYDSIGEGKFLSVKYGFIPPDLVIVHTEDITDKIEVLERLKKSESELKRSNENLKIRITSSEEQYRTIFENTGTATVIIEEDTMISLVNRQFEELSGYSREEIEWKKKWTEFVVKEDLDRMKDLHYSRRIDSESTLKKYEFRFINKEGNIRNIFLIIDMIHGTKKSVASLLDITERKKIEEKLKESEEKYRVAFNRAEFYKDIFAHDINNILQAILSGLELRNLIFDNYEKQEELKENTRNIKNQIMRGAKLVSNVRKLSQLEEAKGNLKKIELLDVFHSVISSVKKSYKAKNLDIRIDSIETFIFVKANDFLEDVFENLIFNAIRHNQNPTIEINVRISIELQNGINYVKMEFIDNGVGVDDIMKEGIFKRGYNEEKSIYGMGLGLSLVRGIIESYNGKIWVEDRINGESASGSNFSILIPEMV